MFQIRVHEADPERKPHGSPWRLPEGLNRVGRRQATWLRWSVATTCTEGFGKWTCTWACMELTWIQLQVRPRGHSRKVSRAEHGNTQDLGRPVLAHTQQARPRVQDTHRKAGPGSGWKFDAGSCRESVALAQLDLAPDIARGCWVSNRGMSPVQTSEHQPHERIQ